MFGTKSGECRCLGYPNTLKGNKVIGGRGKTVLQIGENRWLKGVNVSFQSDLPKPRLRHTVGVNNLPFTFRIGCVWMDTGLFGKLFPYILDGLWQGVIFFTKTAFLVLLTGATRTGIIPTDLSIHLANRPPIPILFLPLIEVHSLLDDG